MQVDVSDLIIMAGSEKIREFRSHPKRLYKYMLCGILHDIIVYGDCFSRPSYGQAKWMSAFPKSFPNKSGQGYEIMINRVIDELKEDFFFQPERDSQVDLLIAFLRKYLHSYNEHQKTLYLVSEISPLLQVKKLVKRVSTVNLKNHHWIDITFKEPLVPTYPEFFNYIDLINIWNDFIEKHNKIIQMIELKENVKVNPIWRELDYSYSSSLRALVILAINFVESYLYYYYYNCKQERKYSTNKVFRIKGYIQDTQIVEDLIFVEHQQIRDSSDVQKLYNTFLNVVKIRDRFVHTSAFVDKDKKVAELQPLLNLRLIDVIFYLQSCVDLIRQIDSMLPTNEKILFWWAHFEVPDFSKKEKISVLNIYRR